MQTDAPNADIPPSLDGTSYTHALHALTMSDPRLAAVHTRHGPPPFWTREPGFLTLLHIILEQQVSLASALAAFRRVQALAHPLTPSTFLALSEQDLRTAGFSRQKTAYGRALAQAILDGEVDLDALHALTDDEVRKTLTRVKGIGPWTADVYLLMALRRPDIWPVGDLALVTAVQEVLVLPSRPSPDELEEVSAPWMPWRAVAARLFWHHYLSTNRIVTRGASPPAAITN